jgi:hypothetical protein
VIPYLNRDGLVLQYVRHYRGGPRGKKIMKICPVCNDSFGDDLNFCDVDGARLAREGVAEERNKWWSLLGAGVLIGGLVITGLSIILIPRARVSVPVVSSEPAPTPASPRVQPVETAPSVAAANPEPEPVANDVVAPELKKKDKALANSNSTGGAPNPKAAALASEGAEKGPTPADARKNEPSTPKAPEAPPAVKPARDARAVDAPPKSPTDVRGDHQPQPANGKGSDKNSTDKKKNDEKDKKKGGFLRVFKKIFGKD